MTTDQTPSQPLPTPIVDGGLDSYLLKVAYEQNAAQSRIIKDLESLSARQCQLLAQIFDDIENPENGDYFSQTELNSIKTQIQALHQEYLTYKKNE
jgi:hypothetical protein